MKNKKLILTMLMIITIIITTSTISAHDDTNTHEVELEKSVQKSIDVQEKSLKQDDETVDVTSYEELYNTISTANAQSKNKTINLHDGNYNITQDIDIKGVRKAITITINGNNNIINGNNQKSFISIQKSNTLIVNNLTITNTQSNRANAIRNLGNCILNNITIKDTYSMYNNSSSGGAIYNTGLMNIDNCKFINNTLDAITFGGAAIYNSNNLTITDSTFENNTSSDGSAIYCLNSKNTLIQNCLFKNNTANSSTIYNLNSNISVENSIFESNNGEYPIGYLLEKGQMDLLNCQITNHSSNKGLIYNNGRIIIKNSSISENNVNKSLFYNNNQLYINDSDINHNNGSVVENNYETVIVNSSITSNKAEDTLTENINENATINIQDSIFTNNTSDHICKEIIATTIINNSTYVNNTCEELYEGSVEHIKASDNTYIGNRLFSQIICEDNHVFNYDEDIQITGIIKTKDVYNTTVTTGKVKLYLNGSCLSYSEVHSNTYNIHITEKIKNSSIFRITFEDVPNYKNCNKSISIDMLYPEYDVQIISPESIEYNTPFDYCIFVKNTQEANGSNIILTNLVPDNLVYISSDSPDYDNNTWHINSLKSNESKNVTLTVKCICSEDILLNITVNDSNTNDSSMHEKVIMVKKPSITMNVSDNSENITLADKLRLNIGIANNGSGKSGNIDVTINMDGSIIYNNTIDSVNSNESITVDYESLINKTGKYNMTLTIHDKVFNITSNKSIEFDIKKPILIVDDVNAHVNDSVNLTAHTINLNSLDNSTIIFKVNNLTITNYQIITDRSNICLKDFIIPSNWKKKNYTLEVKLYKKGFENVLSGTSSINLLKLNVYSVVYNVTGFPNDKITLKAIITDERNQKVDTGIARFKINGITINKNIYVKNGVALLEDYVIPSNYRGPKYTLSLVYGENNIYHSNRNYSTITLEKEESDIDITNTTFIRRENFTVYARIYRKSNNESASGGKAIVKINRKTVSPVLDVSNGEISFTYPNIPASHIDCIIVCYSGNNILLASRKVVGINKFNYG